MKEGVGLTNRQHLKSVGLLPSSDIIFLHASIIFFVFTSFISITRFSISPITAWFTVIIDVKYWLPIQLYFLCSHAAYASGMRIVPLYTCTSMHIKLHDPDPGRLGHSHTNHEACSGWQQDFCLPEISVIWGVGCTVQALLFVQPEFDYF
jgi:hypothetical protein